MDPDRQTHPEILAKLAQSEIDSAVRRFEAVAIMRRQTSDPSVPLMGVTVSKPDAEPSDKSE